MRRRGQLSPAELTVVRGKTSDEEAFEKFYKDCHLRNLRPATIQCYNDALHACNKENNKQTICRMEREGRRRVYNKEHRVNESYYYIIRG